MKVLYGVGLFVLCSLFFLSLNAQEKLVHYEVEDGLPSSGAYFVHEDFDGYIWVCTGDGVARYNGYEFEIFNTENGLTNNFVLKIFEDAEHDLYFTCIDGSISCYNYKTKKFSAFWANTQIKEKLNSKGFISFIGFDGDDIYLHPIARNQIRFAYRFKTSQQKEKLTIEQINEEKDFDYDNVIDIVKGLRGKEYINDILAIKSSQKMLDFYKKNYKDYANNPSVYIGKQEIVYSNKDGVYIQTKTDSRFYPFPGATHAIRDREGNLWVSTEPNGIFKLSPSSFSCFQAVDFLENGDRLWVAKGIGEFIFLGTRNNVLFEYDIKESSMNKIGKLEGAQFVHKGIFSIEDTLYPSTVFKISLKEKKLKLRQTNFANFGTFCKISNGNIVAVDRNTISYYNSYKGLNRLDSSLNDNKCSLSINVKSRYGYGIKRQVKVKGSIRRAHILPNGEVYYTISNGGLYKVDSQFQVQNITKLYGLENFEIRDIIGLGNENGIVLATNKGVVFFKGKVLKWLTTKDGLLSNIISSVLSYDNESIWCATIKGISRIKFLEGNFTSSQITIDNFSVENGLGQNDFRELEEHKGIVYAISDKGLISFPEDISLQKTPLPKIHLLQWTQGDRRLSFDHQSFAHDENNMKMEYLGIAMQKPLGRPFYRYKLIKGRGKADWVYTNNRNIEFNQLSTGAYTFYITARNINDQWAKPKQCTFTIRPHWTGLWWVQTLVFGLLLITLYIFYRRDRSKRKEKYEKELAVVQLREKLNATELALLRGQMNPHFVYNALNSVQKFLLKDDKFGANIFISKLAKMLRSGLEFSRVEYISLQEEIDFLENYMIIETQRFPNRFSFAINCDENLDVEDLQIPPLLVQPLCENAIKHAYDGEKIDIEIQIKKYQSQSILFIITDNGSGYLNAFDNKNSHKSLGIHIIQKRIDIFTEKGYDVSCTFDYLDKKTQKGTRIELIIPLL